MKTTLIVLAAAALLAPVAQANGEAGICLPENPALDIACVYNCSEGDPCPHEGQESNHYSGLEIVDEGLLVELEGYALCGYDEEDDHVWDDHGAVARVFVGERWDPIVGARAIWWFFDETEEGEYHVSKGIETEVYASGNRLRLTWESDDEECWVSVRTQDGVDYYDCPAGSDPPGAPRVPWGLSVLP